MRLSASVAIVAEIATIVFRIFPVTVNVATLSLYRRALQRNLSAIEADVPSVVPGAIDTDGMSVISDVASVSANVVPIPDDVAVIATNVSAILPDVLPDGALIHVEGAPRVARGRGLGRRLSTRRNSGDGECSDRRGGKHSVFHVLYLNSEGPRARSAPSHL